MNDQQKIQILTNQGLSTEEAKTAITTTAISTSQKAATASTTGFTTALKGLWATMMANPLIAIGMVVTAISTVWNMHKRSVEEAIQASNKATDEFNSTSSAIKDYADRYKELHTELLDANTSEERQREIKSDLLSLQKELNDSYGDEHGRLNLVTDAYKDQTKAILDMNKVAAQNYLLDNKKGIETATREMAKERTYELGSTGILNDDYSKGLYNIASLYKDQGVSLTQIEGTDLPAYTITFNGNADEAEKVIRELSNKIQDLDAKFKDHDAVGSVLSYTTSALKNNKSILDNYQADYNASLMANIAYDDELSKGYDKAFEAVTRYNEAIISGDEIKILDARNNLNEVKDSIDLSSEKWVRYGSIMSDVFDEANTGLYDFRDALADNKNGMGNLLPSLQGKTKEELLATQDDDKIDNFDKLIFSADDYRLTVDQVIDELVRMGVVQDNVVSKDAFAPLSKQEVITNINSLSEGFESLDKIMKSISDKDNPFDYALLDDTKFKDNFGELGEVYANFIETVSNSPKDVDATQSAFNDLITTWIDSEDVLTGLTDETANLAVAMLQNRGVANAEEVVMNRLSLAHAEVAAEKYYNANASGSLNDATIDEVNAFVDESDAAGISKQALSELALQKLSVNNVKVDTSSDVDQVIALANAAGASATVLAKLAQAKSIIAKAEAGALNGSVGDLRQYEAAQSMLSDIKNGTFDFQTTLDPEKYKKAVYNGDSKTNKPSGSKKDKKDTSKDIDWIARATKAAQDNYAKLEELANKDTIAYLGLTQEEFDNAKSIFDNGLGNTAEGLAQLQSYANEAGLSLGELYTMIQSGAPGASKENALQSMIKMQTETLLPQYQREVEAYLKSYEDALKAIPSEYKDKIESGGADIESLPADLAKKVQTAIDANEKLKSSEKQLADGEKEHIETIKKLHENRIDATDIENEKLEQSNKIIKSQMELLEARGEIIDADFYKRQIENNKGLISGNQQKIDEWESEMADLRAATNFSTNSKDYKELQAKVKAAKNEIQGLKLEQEEWNETLKQMPIDNLSTIISMYGDITAKIENWGTVYTATGQKLDGEYYQTLISNGITVIEQYGKKAKLVKNLMGEYKKGSTKWQELYKQLQDIDSATSSMLSNLKKYNEELLKMPLDSINIYSGSLQKVADGLSNVQSEQDFVIGTVTNAIQKQIDTINDQKNAYQEANESQKKGLQDKLDLLQKQNDQLKRQMAYEQSLYNLQKINQQATELVIRNGQESYEVDTDKLREAQEQVASAKFDLETGAIQDQIDALDEALEKQNELYDSQIEKLEIILNRWSEISEKVKTAQDEAKTSSILGNKWKDQVLSGNDTTLFNTFSGMYQNTAEQLKKYQDQIDSTNNIQSLLEDYVASYKAGEITYSEAVRGINALLSQLNQNISATGNLQNIFDYLSIVNDTSANADSILKGIQSGLKDTATELLKSMEQYNKNSGIISEHTSSWQKLTSNVEKMLDVLREVRDNLKDSYDRDDDDDNDNTRYGGGRDGSPGTPGKGDYVNSGPGVKFATSQKDGIARGLIGSYSDFDREASMKLLGLKKLDPDEIPAVLHMGEAVFNKEQQQNLLDNFASAYSFAPNIPDYSNLLNNVGIANRTTTPVITFNGGINIQECNNSDDLASEILNGGLTMAINQGLGRR